MKKVLFFLLLFIVFTSLKLYSQQVYISSMAVFRGTNNTCTAYDATLDRSLTSDSVGARIEFDRPTTSYPGSCLSLCAWIQVVVKATADWTMGIDELYFEIFKFRPGANPLDPNSTPPIRTIRMDNIGTVDMRTQNVHTLGPYCAAWDGSYNVDGFWGKTNGIFGFRATVRINEVSPTAGNINIQQTGAFPGQNQNPITVDVLNVHAARLNSVVIDGMLTGLNIIYRLSKDANVTVTIEDGSGKRIRTLVDNLPRYGEGIPNGTLSNGEFWDLRDDYGQKVSLGTYFIRIKASGTDYYGYDDSEILLSTNITSYFSSISLKNIDKKDLGKSSTDYANISFNLTENGTYYIDIYPMGTTFANLNCSTRSITVECGPSNLPIVSTYSYSIKGQNINFLWDGKDSNGNYLCDGDYVFALTAVNDDGIWTHSISTGVIKINKGETLKYFNVLPTKVNDEVNSLRPFYFNFETYRPSNVVIKIFDKNNHEITTLVDNNFTANNQHSITWNGTASTNFMVPKGEYRAEMVLTDNFKCQANKISTYTYSFNFDPYRIYGLNVSSLTFDSPSSFTYTISEPMKTVLKIYKGDTTFKNSTPECKDGTGDDKCMISVFVSTRDSRGKVLHIWDYPDLGNDKYVYKIFASTDFNEIDENGNCLNGECKSLVEDIFIGTIAVNRLFLSTFTIRQVLDDFSDNNYLQYSYGLNTNADVNFEVLDSSGNKIYSETKLNANSGPNTYIWDFKISSYSYLDEGNYYIKLKAVSNGKYDIITSTEFTFNPYRVFNVSISTYSVDNPIRFGLKTFKSATIILKICDTEIKNNCYFTYRSKNTNHLLLWNGRDNNGMRLKNGNYKATVYVLTDDCDDISNKCQVKYQKDFNFSLDRADITVSTEEVSINDKKDIVLVLPDKEIKVEMPPQTFSKNVTINISTVNISEVGGIFDDTVKPLNFSFKIKTNDNTQPLKPVKFYIDYSDDGLNGVDESKLVITRYVPENGRWVILKSKVYPNINRVEAETDHFSVFTLSQLVPVNTISNIRIYPNPFNPVKDIYGMKITGLPSTCDIHIFSITGELVKEFKCDGSGLIVWNGRSKTNNIVGSGVYVIRITSNYGNKKIKIIVEK